MAIQVIENFLSKIFFEDLKTLVLESEFAWFKRKTMVKNTTNNLGYFTHSFYNDHKINCNTYFKFILPILNNLNAKAIIEVRANLQPSVFFNKNGKTNFHIDNNYNCKTAILYLNTNDGGTEFKFKDKIKFIQSEENKIIVFNSNIEHRAVTSKNCDFRYLINFNYFD
tara:strand:+ start:313 stop:816 length:504 start_codon:yes stop_codon:yes gene_type:complete